LANAVAAPLYTTEYVVSDRQHASDDGFAEE